MSDSTQESPQENPGEDAVTRSGDEPLTSAEVRQAASDLYTHAKDVAGSYWVDAKLGWLRPVRKEVRSWVRAGKGFLDGLGQEDKGS